MHSMFLENLYCRTQREVTNIDTYKKIVSINLNFIEKKGVFYIMITATKIENNANVYIKITFKHIARKIFHKNLLILGIILSVCTNVLCSGELDRKLSLDDLHMVQNQLPENIFPHWIKTGILLHVQPPVLNEIATQCADDYHGAHTKMLHKWLTGGTMSNDVRTPTLRELAIAIGASCGGACPLTAIKIFEQHGDGETYESALKNLRENSRTIDGQKNNNLAFVAYLIRTYFSSQENFSDCGELGKTLSSVDMNYAALPILFAIFYPFATDSKELYHIGIRLGISTNEVSKITREESPIETNELNVVLFELLYYALKNHSKKLRWSFIVDAMLLVSKNLQESNAMQKAIHQNSRI